MDKYYTPEIEEFHVGFEFESHITSMTTEPQRETNQWVTSVLGNKDTPHAELVTASYYIAHGDVNFDRVRVKYLDREDIEGEGFSLVEGNPDFNFVSLIQHEDVRGKTYYTIVFSIGKGGPWVRVQANRATLFAGHVKNKSELKRILKQIGYEKP